MKTYTIFTRSEPDARGRVRLIKIGRGAPADDGTIEVTLDALPMSGKFVLVENEAPTRA